MTDKIIDSLILRVTFSHNKILDLVRDIDESDFVKPPSSVAPPIGWHVWHIARSVDSRQARYREQSQVWEQEDMVTKFGLDASKLGMA